MPPDFLSAGLRFALLLGVLGVSRVASADPLRLQGVAAPAHALGGYQQKELAYGVGMNAMVEYAFSPKLAAGVKLGWVRLAKGREPEDPGLQPIGEATAYAGSIGVTSYPFAKSVDGQSFSTEGVWVQGTLGAASTGGRLRGVFDAFLGWDLLFPLPSLGAGPTAGFLHVFQPDGGARPDDANVAMLGVHVRYWPQTSRAPKRASDRDGDGIEDSADRCPDVPEDRDGFEDEDGCPDVDNDRDGIPDSIDKCPLEAEDVDKFQDEDGCPDLDNDQDGLPDTEDLCPNEPETFNGFTDHDGCPDEAQVRVVGGNIVLDERVHFLNSSAAIEPASFALLEHLAKLLLEHREYIHISVEGHADERGSDELNLRLSRDRAQAVVEFLASHGVERSRLSAEGFGSSRPLVDKRSQQAWSMNRRVEFVVTREGTATPPPAVPPAPAPAAKPKPPAPGVKP